MEDVEGSRVLFQRLIISLIFVFRTVPQLWLHLFWRPRRVCLEVSLSRHFELNCFVLVCLGWLSALHILVKEGRSALRVRSGCGRSMDGARGLGHLRRTASVSMMFWCFASSSESDDSVGQLLGAQLGLWCQLAAKLAFLRMDFLHLFRQSRGSLASI